MQCLIGVSEAKPVSNEDFGKATKGKALWCSQKCNCAKISSWCYLFPVTFSLSSNQRETAKSQCCKLSLVLEIRLLTCRTRVGWETVFTSYKTFQGFKAFPCSTLGNETRVNVKSEWKKLQDKQWVGVDGAHPQTRSNPVLSPLN